MYTQTPDYEYCVLEDEKNFLFTGVSNGDNFTSIETLQMKESDIT